MLSPIEYEIVVNSKPIKQHAEVFILKNRLKLQQQKKKLMRILAKLNFPCKNMDLTL